MKTRILSLALGLLILASAPAAQAVTFQFVTVGNLGNPPDPLNAGVGSKPPDLGSVAHEYRIATTEVTIGQYVEFLNAVAVIDQNGLYYTSMNEDIVTGRIQRSGSPGSYSYTALDNPNVPVARVSWFSAVRFCNWMHNGQPGGGQDETTTEDGAYTFSGATTVGPRRADAKFFLPTVNELYKAAFHQPAAEGGDSDDYWIYPFQANDVPFSDNPLSLNTPDDTRAGNFFADDSVANGFDDGYAVNGSTALPTDLALTPVGAYEQATSYYGAFDMGGNLYEWIETTFAGGAAADIQGGVWNTGEDGLRSSAIGGAITDNDHAIIGFRAQPVPSTRTATD